MNKTFLKKGILLVPIAFFVFLFFFELNSKSEGKFNQKADFIVELREEGFFPQELTIQKGQKVKFTTARNKPFWIASNLHPSHAIYPEFDSNEPIFQDESWSFTFNKLGTWKYHDHLVPIYKGTITIVEQREREDMQSQKRECEDIPQDQRVECLEKVIVLTLKEEGLNAAFGVLDNLYASDPRFSTGCHEYTHIIGEEAYRLFAAKKDLDLTTKTSYCGYGFYHGFMETLLHTTGDITKAHDFCTYVSQELEGETSRAGSEACYHGIGHGAVDAGDKRTWGDAEAIIGPGLKICEMIGETELKMHVCGNGVFNALAIMFLNSEYRLSLDEDNPFWICELQLKPYFKKSCYRQLTRLVTYSTNRNFLQSLTFVEKATEDEYVPNTIASLAQRVARFYSDEYYFSDIIRDCRTLQRSLRSLCIGGFAVGLMEFGPPEKEYVGAITFCQMRTLNEEERYVCFKKMLSRSAGSYSSEKYSYICSLIDTRYRTLCLLP